MAVVHLNTSTRPYREVRTALRVRARLIHAAEGKVDQAWLPARLELWDPHGVPAQSSAWGRALDDLEVNRGRQGVNQLRARLGCHLQGNLITERTSPLGPKGREQIIVMDAVESMANVDDTPSVSL